MRSEQSPFRNVALCADTDRIYHRIGSIGDPDAVLPRMSAAAQIQPDGNGNWEVLENREVRATYPRQAIRFSILWKAGVRERESGTDNLTLDRIMTIFSGDLHHRGVGFEAPSDPLADTAWILLLQRIYSDAIATLGG